MKTFTIELTDDEAKLFEEELSTSIRKWTESCFGHSDEYICQFCGCGVPDKSYHYEDINHKYDCPAPKIRSALRGMD